MRNNSIGNYVVIVSAFEDEDFLEEKFEEKINKEISSIQTTGDYISDIKYNVVVNSGMIHHKVMIICRRDN